MKTNGVMSDGVMSDGVKTDGVRTDGVKTDGVKTDGVRMSDGVRIRFYFLRRLADGVTVARRNTSPHPHCS